MHASAWRRARRALSALGPGAVAALLIGWIGASRGGDLPAALASCPAWVLAGATLAHLGTLLLRTEAWRTVLRAAGGEALDPGAMHAANAGAFLAGAVQGHAAMPARIALLQRFGGNASPGAAQIALADAPILIFEICTSALLAAVASTAVGGIPAWVPWAMVAGAASLLGLLRLTYGRFRHREFAAGLAVLARPRLRGRLAVTVAAFTAMALLRTWMVLAGFGLPSGPADVCLVLFSMGAIGLLPIGIGTGPAAMVAAIGSTDLAAATAAGMVVSAATVLAVVVYAATTWAWRVLLGRPVPA
jgi:hypothetical protein